MVPAVQQARTSSSVNKREMMSEEKMSYYKENLPKVIDKLKNSIDNILDIIDKKIDGELTDDKYLNVLKAKRQASEDAIWVMKRIDELENELNGVENETEQPQDVTVTVNYAKLRAQKKNQQPK